MINEISFGGHHHHHPHRHHLHPHHHNLLVQQPGAFALLDLTTRLQQEVRRGEEVKGGGLVARYQTILIFCLHWILEYFDKTWW